MLPDTAVIHVVHAPLRTSSVRYDCVLRDTLPIFLPVDVSVSPESGLSLSNRSVVFARSTRGTVSWRCDGKGQEPAYLGGVKNLSGGLCQAMTVWRARDPTAWR